MGKLIDADAIQYTDLNGDHPESKVRVYVAFKENIDRMPTVDAVLVKRCDGCRYADWHSNGCIAYCTKHRSDGFVADDFCSYGERDGDSHD